MASIQDQLIQFYSKTSKHSNYQILPTRLQKLIGAHEVQTKTRSEAERLAYILDLVDVQGKTVLDIGGNTGYFTFELLDAGAKSVDYYDGNKEHADFVALAAQALELQNRVRVVHAYYDFMNPGIQAYDIVLLLNVLHHVGDDYGDQALSIDQAKTDIVKQLNSFQKLTDILVFQLGFNWKGNPELGLFEHGSKTEMIELVKAAAEGVWDIIAIGVPEQDTDRVVYRNLDEENIKRVDSLGEFLNRPLFILKSK